MHNMLVAHRYEIIDKLGEGGEGRVFRVLDRQRQGRKCALKLARTGATAVELELFRREFQILCQLNHPQVVRVLDFGVTAHDELTAGEPSPYYTREVIEGTSLAEHTGGAPGELAAWAESLLQVTGFLHSSGVLHRDLKPDNILLKASDEGVIPVLVDFGLAGAERAAGTLAYLAPEILEGEPATPLTDLYALGATLCELGTGVKPVEGGSPDAVVADILAGGPAIRAARAALPVPLNKLVSRLLARDPGKRPTSARQALVLLTGRAEEQVDRVAPEAVPPLCGAGESILSELVPRGSDPASAPGRFFLLTGPPGSGKTRLLSELCWRLQLEGVRVVELGCRPGGGTGTFDELAGAVLAGEAQPHVKAVDLWHQPKETPE